MNAKLTLWGLLMCWCIQPAFAQNTQFRTEDVLPHTIAIKYKATQQKLLAVDARLYRPVATLPAEVQNHLGIIAQKEMIEANHPLITAPYNPKWGENCKKLGLIYVLTLAPEYDLKRAIQALRQMPGIEYAEPIYTNYAHLYVPNDPQANPASNPQAYHLKTVKAYEAWDVQKGSASMVIGITDNGFDTALTDLVGQDVSPAGLNRDLADNDNIVSGDAHGTGVAKVAVGKANNGVGGAGICFDCKYLPLKVAPNTNLQSYTAGYLGILTAAQKDCKVVNMSWGRKGYPSALELDFLESTVNDFDVVLVAAAGNDGDKLDPTGLFFPASYNSVVLSVAATTNTDARAAFSTYNSSVDLCAPGAGIVTQSGNDNGTSFASPIVAGAAALVRAQFPAWNAAQVRARLVSTTDNIYSIAGNQVGTLGSGRLNIQRALIDPLAAVTLQSYTFANAKRNYLFGGMTSNMTVSLRNHLDALTNLQVSLTTNSPYLTILDGNAAIGAVAANTTVTNAADALTVQVANGINANTLATLVFTYTDGAFTFSERVIIILNPAHVDNNQLKLTHNEKGKLAVVEPLAPLINGFQWQGESIANEAGLLLATSNTKVSNTVRSDAGLFDDTFTRLSTNNEATNGTLLTTTAAFEDMTNNGNRIGLEVVQNMYAWNETEVNKSVVLEYKIKNAAGGSINNLYAGVFTNWDLGDNTKNLGDWDGENVLGYVRESAINGWYAGITCLTERDIAISSQKIHYYAFDNATSTIIIQDGFSKAEKFNALAGGIAKPQAGTGQGTDVAHLLGVRLPEFLLGQTRTVAFAYVVGESLADLKTQAIAIRNRYKVAKTSPTPTVTNVAVCYGGQAIVTPTGGSKFNFYAAEPIDESVPILFTGSSLLINNITIPQTIWVASVDSVFMGAAVPLQITLTTHTTAFTQPATTLNLAANTEMTLTSTGAGATIWNWYITKDGGIANADITFINGTSALSAAPALKFTKNGTYSFKLVSRTAQGCKDSLTKTLFVYTDFTTAIPEILRNHTTLYPNPAQDACYIRIAQVRDNITLHLTNQEGKEVRNLAYPNNPDKPYKLALEGLPAGVYLLRIQLRQGEWTEKLMIEKP